MPPATSTRIPPNWKPHRIEGHYDIRKGAAGYAPIVGAFGSLAVPAIILLFTTPKPHVLNQTADTAMAAGLLVVAMVGSVIASIAMAAIGAEIDETANLPAEIMYEGLAVVVSLIDVLAAFAALAALYLPSASLLLILITGIGGLIGIFFMAAVVADSFHSGPTDPNDLAIWRPTQWIQSREHAEAASNVVAAIAAVPTIFGIVLRILDFRILPTTTTATSITIASLAITVFGIVVGVLRSAHALDGFQKGLRPTEAIGTTALASLYVFALMIFLP
jgi:hypothetical protein